MGFLGLGKKSSQPLFTGQTDAPQSNNTMQSSPSQGNSGGGGGGWQDIARGGLDLANQFMQSRQQNQPQQQQPQQQMGGGGGGMMRGGGGGMQQPQPRQMPQMGGGRPQFGGGRMGGGGMNRMGGSAGIGPSQQADPYYNPSLPGTRAGAQYDSEGPSFGDDASGRINRMNPTMNPDLPFVQRGTTGGYSDAGGISIGAGRSITPAQYQAQIAQAQAAGIPQDWIQSYLQRNPGDSNRLLEGYASEDGGRYAGQMQSAMQTPWTQFAGQAAGPQPGPSDGGEMGYDPMMGGGQMMGGQMMGGQMPPNIQTGQYNPMANRRMGRRSATQGRMGISPSMAPSYGN